MPEFDVVIKGGTVVDGTGAAARTADVAIRDGVVVEVGEVSGSAARQVDAAGALVTPGFVDIHSHYDGQATWDERLTPSSWHGVTTVVMGNCGVGFSPVHEPDHQRLVELMEGVEDIPGAALHEGLSWDWKDFGGYLDALERRPHDIDFAAQLPHGALRLFVMGERGANREAASAEEIAEMGRLARQAVEAGALGFTTSRTLNHRTSKGEPTPTLTAAEEELVGIAAALGQAGKGVLQVVSDFVDFDTEFSTLRHMVEVSGRPLSISVAQADQRPGGYRQLLDGIAAAASAGYPVKGQVAARAVGVLFGLQATLNPLLASPAYREIHDRPLAERVAKLSDPGLRQRILEEVAQVEDRGGRGRGMLVRWERMFELGDPPNYEPAAEMSVAARAAREGRSAAELAYDLLLGDEGRAFLYLPILNYTDGSLDVVREIIMHEHTVVGLADGGAHVGTICDASFPTTLLTHWARDRQRSSGREGVPLEHLIRRQTRDTAATVGLFDRGVLAPGMKADVNVIDFDGLRLRPPVMAFDLPAGGKRLLQRADGYLHTFVSGAEVYTDGEATGELPGRLVRGAQPSPA